MEQESSLAIGNTYNASFFSDESTGGVLARLNNQAPKLPDDNALDYLSFSVGAVIPLLNQSNPKPAAPILTSSNTVLAVSANTANENQQTDLHRHGHGIHSYRHVSFTSGATTLGTAAVTNGTAALSARLPLRHLCGHRQLCGGQRKPA